MVDFHLVILNGRLNAAVESDVVGYTTIEMGRGFSIIALPFEELVEREDGTRGYPIQNISGDLVQNDRLARADVIMVWDATSKSYTTYYYKTAGWTKEGESEPTEDILPPGAAIFFKKVDGTGSATVAGKIVADDTYTLSLSRGYNLVCNPYFTDIKINDLTGNLIQNIRDARADSIMVWDATNKSYVTYYYKPDGWMKKGEDAVTTDVIPACQGFYLKKNDADGTLVFTNPYSNN